MSGISQNTNRETLEEIADADIISS